MSEVKTARDGDRKRKEDLTGDSEVQLFLPH